MTKTAFETPAFEKIQSAFNLLCDLPEESRRDALTWLRKNSAELAADVVALLEYDARELPDLPDFPSSEPGETIPPIS